MTCVASRLGATVAVAVAAIVGLGVAAGVAALLLVGVAGAFASRANASTQPQFGGTLRVQISERVTTIDPRQWPSESTKADVAERVNSLVFDRLVRLDDKAGLQPALAISWEHDAQAKRWLFRIREGVKFSDGTALTPAIGRVYTAGAVRATGHGARKSQGPPRREETV